VTAPALPAALVAAVETEPELPGDMPEDFRHYSTMDVARAAVKVTKRNVLSAMEAAWPAVLAGVELAAAASELRLRGALGEVSKHLEAAIALPRGDDREHMYDTARAIVRLWRRPDLAAPPSRAAEALAELLALPGRLERRAAEFSWESANTVGGDRELVRVARELRAALAKLGGTT
jgi:hypothetical protein